MGPGIIQAPAFFEEMQPNPVRNAVGGARVIGAVILALGALTADEGRCTAPGLSGAPLFTGDFPGFAG